MITPIMSSYPALRPGVNYLIKHEEHQSYALVGTANFGIKIVGHNSILFLQKAKGQLELNEIMKDIGLTSNQLLEVIEPLIRNNLLILSTTPTYLNPTGEDDVSRNVSANRITPELNTLAWRKTPSPVLDLISRREKEILILGENRLAFALFELFQSIGYLNCKVIEKTKGEVHSQLVGATPIRMSEIGVRLSEMRERIIREYALNFAALRVKNQGLKLSPEKLVINTSQFQLEDYADLIVDGAAHIQIGNLNAGKIEVGPIVIPGKTPCYNCILLWRSEEMNDLANLFLSNLLLKPLELPAASVTYLAGLVVLLIDNFFAMEKSFLIGSSIVINLLKPLEFTERFWQPHPRCGCLELL